MTVQPTIARRSTITDVARDAKVSIKTVSRVVRREPNVSEDTRKLVQASIDRLNYRPTISARSTTSGRSFLIGLVYDNPNPAYTLDLMRGAQQAVRADGYHLVVEPLEAGAGAGREIADLVVQSNLDGLIVPPPLCDDPAVLDALATLGKPFARIAPGTEPEFGLTVAMDDVAAVRAMTDYLIGLGHRRIGFVKGRAGTATTRKRLEGYQATMRDAGLTVVQDWIYQGDFRMRSGVEAGDALLSLTERPTAIFASNDEMAAGVIMAAHRRGLSVPGDLSVAGFDDSLTAQAMWPAITTVRQPVAELAAAAARRIIAFQRNGRPDRTGAEMLDFALVERESTGPAPGH